MIVKDDSKAVFWSQSNPNSSNSQVIDLKGTLIGERIRSKEVVGMITITNRPLGIINQEITLIETRLIVTIRHRRLTPKRLSLSGLLLLK